MLMFGKQYRKWSCPVCKQPTNGVSRTIIEFGPPPLIDVPLVETLRVDSFFAKVLAGAGPDIEQGGCPYLCRASLFGLTVN